MFLAARLGRWKVSKALRVGNGKRANGHLDILEIHLAERLERKRQFVADLIVNTSRNADAARLGSGLQAGGNIDAIAKEIIAVEHDVAEVDADPESDLAVGRQLIVAGAQCSLNVGRAAHSFDGTGKFGKDGVARGIEDAPAVPVDQGLEDLLVTSKCPERALFVFTHEAAELSDIGGEDSREFANQGLSTWFFGLYHQDRSRLGRAVWIRRV
jgi:hypothetical protein